MHALSLALSSALALTGAGVAVAAGYLVALAAAATRHRPRPAAGRPRHRIAVLVPAHDEAELVGRCVRSLVDQRYPRELLQVVVIADNCSDATAPTAAQAGARVLVRDDPGARGKGQALRWAMDRLLAEPAPPDAIAVVDADSVADPELLRELEAALRAGAPVAQAEYLVLASTGSQREELVAAAFLLFHRVRLAGRAALGMPAALVGNGMMFSRRTLEEHPWDAFIGAEDLEYSINLRLAGVRPAFVAAARVWGPMPDRPAAAGRQRLRWEGGRFHVVRTRLGGLVAGAWRRRDPGLLDAALDLAVPPLAVLTLAVALGLAAAIAGGALGLVAWWAAAPWAVAALFLPGFVFGGLVAAGAPPSTWRALRGAPPFLAWKLVAYARLGRGYDVKRWDRSEREPSERALGRPLLWGVPVDPVDTAAALAGIAAAVGRGRLFHVATVNLDFLVSALRDAQVRDIFRRSSLNVADGAPVVWLARLLGHRVPERVAGADLVPLLAAQAARDGHSLFLLGGEGGTAAAAAAELVRRHPGLRIAGCLEPPRARVEDMDSEAILRQVEASGADILLVALGHPKQERWIDLNRDRLPLVAIGVGCVFDLIAGRVRRAPAWMRRAGLEWLFRLGQEPGRLARRYATDASWLVLLTTRALLQRLA